MKEEIIKLPDGLKIIKSFIPHKCKFCGAKLYHTDVYKNYIYFQNKKGYYYSCNDCFKKNKING